ncbi:TonB-dependent receptor plug domain-containing protein [Rhodomicrobium lacus]|uniref:TonB-dependent receptor plug domain-containing protein n=1 Tax=Rhodomicrobium lacus TaxID=2498452 RepID=UPI0026E332AE|nr:TonB-dependent receptor [Rhodomicrobium lacus]WKW52018.1 TonB-dependent receptor [Rhodomicrobium lacus]
MPALYPRARSCVAFVSLVAFAANAQAQTAARSDTLPPVVVKKDGAEKQKKKASAPKKKKEAPAVAHGAAEPAPDAIPGEPSKDVIYSANRVATDITKVGSAVTVITRDEIEAQSRTYVQDYLAQVPGVSVAQTGPASTTSYFIWGAASKYVKVQVDGLDIADPTGTQVTTALETILATDVERIEVLKGSQSLLYGGQAIGGVITIDTARPVLGASMTASGETGSYNTQRSTASAAYGTDRGYARFTVQSVRSDGYSALAIGNEDDGYRNLTFSGTGEYKLSSDVKVFFAARALEERHSYDSTYDNWDLATDGWPGTRGVTSQQAGRVGTEVKLFDGAFVNTVSIQGMKFDRDQWGWSAGSAVNDSYTGDRWKVDYLGTAKITKWATVTAGADYMEETAETGAYSQHGIDLTGVFAQLSVEPLKGLTITGGGRNDEHSTFGDFQTYRFTAAYFYEPTQTKLRASTGTGFRAPSLYELYANNKWVSGNTELKPEESESYDVGFDQWFDNRRLRLSGTYFQVDTTNEIGGGYDANWKWVYQQIPGTTHREGVEFSGAAVVSPWLTLSAGYTYVDARAEDGSRLVRIPRNSITLGADALLFDTVKANVTTRFALDTIDSSNYQLEDYVLLNAKFSYDIRPGFTAYVRGENLLDEKYETVRGYNTPGLSVYGGITFNVDANTYASLK